MNNIRQGNKQLIKELNRAIVINTILNCGPLSRTRIAELTDLNLSTVSNIVSDLISKELIHETGEGKSKGGRRPILLEFNSNEKSVLGIKVGLDGIVIGLLNLKSEVLDKEFIPCPIKQEEKRILEVLSKSIQELLKKNKIKLEEIVGCGIGISGLVNQKEGYLVFSPILQWKKVRFREILEEKFKFPVFIDKDVNTLALAEKRFGAGKNINHFICITIGKGVGAGVVINGEIYYGSYGGAGDFGHIIIEKDGPRCYCGKKGCLEIFSSDQFVISRMKEFLVKKDSQEIRNFFTAKKDLTLLSVQDILELATKGEAISQGIFRELGENLSWGIMNLISLFDPELILIGGDGAKAGELILHPIRKKIKDYFPFKPELKILPTQTGEDGWITGAAELVLQEVFKTPIFKPKKEVALKSAFHW
ncbi:MAG: xylose repressor [Candidatus Caldatribacteriota bacterium]